MSEPVELLRAEDLVVRFPAGGRRRWIVPVDHLSLTIGQGESVGVVGESGSGKTTLGRTLVRILEPAVGHLQWQNQDVAHIRGRALRHYHAAVQMVFQDPFASLNPARTLFDQVALPIRYHRGLSGTQQAERVESLLEQVGLYPARDLREKYPHELSGGQRQRVAIARALAAKPRLVVADEPVSMLDVSIRAGILQLLTELKEQLALSFVFITHDLASARYFSARIAVMYAGRLVEMAAAADIIRRPLHPYTRLLMAASPGSGMKGPLPETSQSSPDLTAQRRGCPFAPRCPLVMERCREEAIDFRWLADQHGVACLRDGE